MGNHKTGCADRIWRIFEHRYFGIIFFSDNRLTEFSGGSLVRASLKSKSLAYDFISSVRPAGRTNAFAALKRAIELRDVSGDGASVIYFLSDGFELCSGFEDRTGDMMSWLIEDVRIYTIGFWPRKDDQRILEEIAK